MFARKKSQRIENILKKYHELAAQDPFILKNKLPSEEIWRFFIDGNRQKGRGLAKNPIFNNTDVLDLTVNDYISAHEKLDITKEENYKKSQLWRFLKRHHWNLTTTEADIFTLSDLLSLDRGWLPFESNEPGYLRALTTAFQNIFNFDVEINNEFIQKLHQLAMVEVKNTQYEIEELDKPGHYRSIDQAYITFKNTNITESGIKEILEKYDTDVSFYLTFFNSNNGTYIGSVHINKDADKRLDSQEIRKIFGELRGNNQSYISVFKELREAKTISDLASCLHRLIDHKSRDYVLEIESHQPTDTYMSLAKKMETATQLFNLSMKESTNAKEKLLKIIKYIQFCERLHPFIDANTRTFSMLLLNHVLMRQGFPPAILNNPNQIATHSEKEVLDLVIKGMENTLELIETKQLFSVHTQDIVSFLKSKPYFKDKYDYIEEVISIEESHRQKLNGGLIV